MKKGELIAIAILGMIFLLPFASAGILNWITGKASSQNLSMGATVSNTVPIITYVAPISNQDASENGAKTVTFKFTAYDHDNNGAIHDLADGSARAEFLTGAEPTRYAACTFVDAQNTEKTSNYTCSVEMWYWDLAGSWKINVTIQDASSAWAENSSTSFTYNQLTAFVMAPTTLNWTSLIPGAQNQGATNDPTVLNNTGNDPIDNIQINATTLVGVTDPTKTIAGNNFTAKITDPACDGTILKDDATYIQIASAELLRGNNTQEDFYYCLDVPASLTKQTYDTSVNGAWTVKIV